MSGFTLVEPQGWEYDLQSVYSAYIGHFQVYNVPWYERSWGHLFESFEEFLAFSWPVITVTDARTGKAHIVTRMTTIGAFLKMIKTRFGETLPVVDNMFIVEPFETGARHLRTVSDWASYKKLHASLPAVAAAAFKVRVKSGDVKAIREVWQGKDKTFLAIDFEWSERNRSTVLEWGYAAVRCGNLTALGRWPPQPDFNYRKGHYVVSDHVDKIVNKRAPTFPWSYSFGDSQLVFKARLPQIIQAIFSSLMSPESDTTSNNVVLVGHGISGDLTRLEEMKIKLPHNILVIDTAIFERNLFVSGERGSMLDAKGKARTTGTQLSLDGLLCSLDADVPCQLHNAGNDALMTLFAFQKLFEPDTPVPTSKRRGPAGAIPAGIPMNGNLMPVVPMSRPMSMNRLPTPVEYTGFFAVVDSSSGSSRPDSTLPHPQQQDEDSSPVRRSRVSTNPNGRRMSNVPVPDGNQSVRRKPRPA